LLPPVNPPEQPPEPPPVPPTIPPEPPTIPPEPPVVPPEPPVPPPSVSPWTDAAAATEDDLRQEAIDVVKQLTVDFPDDADPMGLLGNLYVAIGDTDEALACWQRCAELDPGVVDSYRGMARIALRKGQNEEARRLAIEADPDAPEIHGQLGRALLGLGRAEDAIAALKREIEISPDDAVGHCLTGQAYQQLQQYEQARQSFFKAIEADPNYTEAYWGIVQTCRRLDRKDETAEYLKKFQELKKQDWANLRDPRDALDDEQFMAGLRRNVAVTHTDAAYFYLDSGRQSYAERLWLRAAELDTQAVACRVELLEMYDRLERIDDALQVCEQLRGIAPKNHQFLAKTAVLCDRDRRTEDALRWIRKALEMDPGNAMYRGIEQQLLKRN